MSMEHAKNYAEAMKQMQALIVADCLDNHFEPLENVKSPQALFPVANVPCLHYVIETLANSQITNIIVAAKSNNKHRDKI